VNTVKSSSNPKAPLGADSVEIDSPTENVNADASGPGMWNRIGRRDGSFADPQWEVILFLL
jgi:hypothetical protein